jgi:4-diphosphocytidyl-2-C-methyl-D-erythritol kinase
MSITVRSFAKINLGLRIGGVRNDGFHELRTVYQTIALHDIVTLSIERGIGAEIRCQDPRVPTDQSNTCYRIVERTIDALEVRGHIIVEIDKRLPVQGGLGGASGNAVAALLALERAAKKLLSGPERLRIATEVGSDLPLFLIGGTVLGVGHGEEVYPLPDLPPVPCVVALPEVAVSTPRAFAEWDARTTKLTHAASFDRMLEFSRMVSAWLSTQQKLRAGKGLSGVSAKGRGRAETPLLDLVRTGIENDFEQVVFPQYPEMREVKRVLERAGAFYASLSGSGSAVYGLFRTVAAARKAATGLRKRGTEAQVTTTLTRNQYWREIFDC